jgi:KDO2-lipid IV(A) lauroyltransferase
VKAVVTQPVPQALRERRAPVPFRELRPSRFGRVRRAAANFWTSFLFWNARRNPWAPRISKPFWMWAGWTFTPVLRETTLSNAARLLGPDSTSAQREALARAVIANFYDFVCDIGAALGMSRRELLDRIEAVEGHERYVSARREGKGAIVVTAHMGSFEVGMAALLEQETRVHVLFRRDDLGQFEKTRSALRRQLGVREACVEDGLAVWMELRAALARDEVVLIQGDRVLPGQKGEPVPFLGGHMMLPTGPIKLALATGAPIIPVFSVRNPDGGIRLFIDELIRVDGDVHEALLRIGAVIEKYVRRFPDQWLVFHRPWCEDAAPEDH